MSKPKTKKLSKIAAPIFDPGRVLSCFGTVAIATDTNGHVWRIDLDLGEAKPVKFAARR